MPQKFEAWYSPTSAFKRMSDEQELGLSHQQLHFIVQRRTRGYGHMVAINFASIIHHCMRDSDNTARVAVSGVEMPAVGILNWP